MEFTRLCLTTATTPAAPTANTRIGPRILLSVDNSPRRLYKAGIMGAGRIPAGGSYVRIFTL
jgi:hypothetical protein